MMGRQGVLGMDCGGTHTDAVFVLDGKIEARAKVATNHEDLPSSVRGVLDALRGQAGEAPLQDAARVTLGTTLLVNACVQGKMARTGLFLSGGPGLAPERFALGEHVCVVPGGLDHRGVEVAPLETGCMKKAMAAWDGVSAFACVGKFSPRNPDHENRMGKVVREMAPSCVLTLGHGLGGALNFPRRVATAWYNSALNRLHNNFLDAVEKVLADFGMHAPVFLLKADGGAVPLARSRPWPVQSLLSGPAASVMGALALDKNLEEKTTLLLDMGGTTSDFALFLAGSPVVDRDGMKVMGRRTLVRSLATRSIGVGGDSAIFIESAADRKAVLHVGPLREGPAMAFGGAKATLLDALNVLNSEDGLDETAGDVAASRKGMEELGGQARISALEAARLVFEDAARQLQTASSGLVREINSRPVYTLKELLEVRDIAFERVYLVGGPAPCVKNRLEQALGVEVTASREADVANAVGAALTRPSAMLEVYADTGKGTLVAPVLGLSEALPSHASPGYVEERARMLLQTELAREGIGNTPVEVASSELFAVLDDHGRGARDMRVSCQVVPGLSSRLRGLKG